MKYTQKSFSVTVPGSKSYAENWERTFRPYVDPPACRGCGHDTECHEKGACDGIIPIPDGTELPCTCQEFVIPI